MHSHKSQALGTPGGGWTRAGALFVRKPQLSVVGRAHHRKRIQCFRPDGSLRWEEIVENLITTVGLQNMSAAAFAAGSQISSWFLMLLSASPTIAVGDTHASHAGWTEYTTIQEATRPAVTLATTTAGIYDNTAALTDFTIDADTQTIGGVAMVGGGAAPSVLGSTAADVLLHSLAAFTGGNKSADTNDIIRVTWEVGTEN